MISLLINNIKSFNNNEFDLSLLPDYPFIQDIVNGTFNSINDKTLEELKQSLFTFNYLMKNSYEVVQELIWRLGEKQELIEKYFTCVDSINHLFELRKDLSKPVMYEIITFFKKDKINKLQFKRIFH